MNLIPGVVKEDYFDYVLYFVENLSDELKQEIRNRLVAVCHGADQAQSPLKIYAYKETVKEFVKRYKTNKDASEDRKKGMIGELLVHVVLELEGRFTTASPFFNMEERSFKKGYDVALFETATNELWIAEVKSGAIQKGQKNASSAAVGLPICISTYHSGSSWSEVTPQLPDNSSGIKITSRQFGERCSNYYFTCSKIMNRSNRKNPSKLLVPRLGTSSKKQKGFLLVDKLATS